MPACRLLLVASQPESSLMLYSVETLIAALARRGPGPGGARRGQEEGGELARAVLLQLSGHYAVGELAGLLHALEDLLGVPCGQGLV